MCVSPTGNQTCAICRAVVLAFLSNASLIFEVPCSPVVKLHSSGSVLLPARFGQWGLLDLPGQPR